MSSSGPDVAIFIRTLWYEAIDGNRTAGVDFADRDGDEGVLYVSYDAGADSLYLSMTGYGPKYAWHTVAGLLQGSWSGRPLWLYLGGGSDGQEIKSGDAYLRQFRRGYGRPRHAHLECRVPVLVAGASSRTSTRSMPKERDQVIKNYPQAWVYEGPVFQAAATANAPGLAPVYRFWSLVGQGHFYTIDPAEKDRVLANYPKVWQLEGVAFYAYPEGAQPPTSKPVYRFWRPNGGDHFYTIDTNERDLVLKTYSQVYTAEGVAFYAFR